MSNHIVKNQRGQSLFEVVVAIGLIGIALVAVVGLLVQGQKNSTSSKDKSAGARAVIQVSEWLRSQRDTDWDTFRTKASTNGTTYCLNSMAWVPGTCSANSTDQPFAKEVTLTSTTNAAKPSCVEVKATIKIIWIGSGNTTDTTNYVFTNWKGGC